MSPVVTLYTTRFNIHKLYSLFTECISVVYGSQKKTEIISSYSIN